MMNQKINTAVVGFGKLGLLHAGLVNAMPQSRLCAVAETSSTMLKLVKENIPDVNTYDNHLKLLDNEDLGAVFIATPTHLHVPLAVDCIKRGIPVFIEKPLANTAAEAKVLYDQVQAAPVVNMVGYCGRYVSTFAKAREIVASGALGKLQMFRSSMYIGQLFKEGKGWRYDKSASGGGVLITQNSHLLDKLIWMFGEPDLVSAHTSQLYSKGVEDAAHVYIRFKNGLGGFLDSSWSARHYRTIAINIHVQGEQGTLDVNDDEIRLFLDQPAAGYEAGWTTLNKPDLYQGITFDIGGPQFTLQADDFFNAILGKGTVGSDIASAFQVQCTLDAAYNSAQQNGAPVSVKEVMASV